MNALETYSILVIISINIISLMKKKCSTVYRGKRTSISTTEVNMAFLPIYLYLGNRYPYGENKVNFAQRG